MSAFLRLQSSSVSFKSFNSSPKLFPSRRTGSIQKNDREIRYLNRGTLLSKRPTWCASAARLNFVQFLGWLPSHAISAGNPHVEIYNSRLNVHSVASCAGEIDVFVYVQANCLCGFMTRDTTSTWVRGDVSLELIFGFVQQVLCIKCPG